MQRTREPTEPTRDDKRRLSKELQKRFGFSKTQSDYLVVNSYGYCSDIIKQLQEIEKSMKGNPPPPPLTEKQMAILRSVTRGLSNQDIAVQFGISPVSVKKHLSVIFTKLGVATRAEAASIALQKHLLKLS